MIFFSKILPQVGIEVPGQNKDKLFGGGDYPGSDNNVSSRKSEDHKDISVEEEVPVDSESLPEEKRVLRLAM